MSLKLITNATKRYNITEFRNKDVQRGYNFSLKMLETFIL